jgi:hypothetical protein
VVVEQQQQNLLYDPTGQSMKKWAEHPFGISMANKRRGATIMGLGMSLMLAAAGYAAVFGGSVHAIPGAGYHPADDAQAFARFEIVSGIVLLGLVVGFGRLLRPTWLHVALYSGLIAVGALAANDDIMRIAGGVN